LFVNLQPVHLVGVPVNVIWVTSQGPCDEHVHQFEMLQYYNTCSNWS